MRFPDTLTDGVPKVPKAPWTPFWHFWHCLTLGTAIERMGRPFLRAVSLIATGPVDCDGEAEWTWVGGTRGEVTARGSADTPLDLIGIQV